MAGQLPPTATGNDLITYEDLKRTAAIRAFDFVRFLFLFRSSHDSPGCGHRRIGLPLDAGAGVDGQLGYQQRQHQPTAGSGDERAESVPALHAAALVFAAHSGRQTHHSVARCATTALFLTAGRLAGAGQMFRGCLLLVGTLTRD